MCTTCKGAWRTSVSVLLKFWPQTYFLWGIQNLCSCRAFFPLLCFVEFISQPWLVFTSIFKYVHICTYVHMIFLVCKKFSLIAFPKRFRETNFILSFFFFFLQEEVIWGPWTEKPDGLWSVALQSQTQFSDWTTATRDGGLP